MRGVTSYGVGDFCRSLPKFGVTQISDSTPETTKHSKLRIGCIACVALLLVAAYFLHRMSEGVHNSYAVWWVADMVVEHMKANDNQWPQNWDDLQDDYQTCVKRSGQPWSFDELSSRTQIDWQAVPSDLLAQSKGHETAQFRVITLTDGTDSHYQSCEPNQIILDYLRLHSSEQ